MKVLNETHAAHALILDIEGMAGTTATVQLRRNAPRLNLKAEGATIEGDSLRITFPSGIGYQPQTMTVRW